MLNPNASKPAATPHQQLLMEMAPLDLVVFTLKVMQYDLQHTWQESHGDMSIHTYENARFQLMEVIHYHSWRGRQGVELQPAAEQDHSFRLAKILRKSSHARELGERISPCCTASYSVIKLDQPIGTIQAGYYSLHSVAGHGEKALKTPISEESAQRLLTKRYDD